MRRFINGLLVGIGIGVFVAPMKGEEMRRLIGERLKEMRQQLQIDRTGGASVLLPPRTQPEQEVGQMEIAPAARDAVLSSAHRTSSTTQGQPVERIEPAGAVAITSTAERLSAEPQVVSVPPAPLSYVKETVQEPVETRAAEAANVIEIGEPEAISALEAASLPDIEAVEMMEVEEPEVVSDLEAASLPDVETINVVEVDIPETVSDLEAASLLDIEEVMPAEGPDVEVPSEAGDELVDVIPDESATTASQQTEPSATTKNTPEKKAPRSRQSSTGKSSTSRSTGSTQRSKRHHHKKA